MSAWGSLFDRADDHEVTVEQVRETLARVRDDRGGNGGGSTGEGATDARE